MVRLMFSVVSAASKNEACFKSGQNRIKKERERDGGLGGRHLAEQRNNQKIAGVSGGGAMEERSDLGGSVG